MKRISRRFSFQAKISVAILLLAFVALGTSSVTQAASPEPGKATAGKATAGKVSKTDRVEARIKELHEKLKITPAQEDQWNAVAQVMRENAQEMDALIKARKEKAGKMTAVEDLKDYSAFADARAAGVKKLVTVFDPLYAGMSDAQKKEADALFGHHGARRHHHHKKSQAQGK
jgi:protein CpxP